ncbi:MAG: hypothetical protein JXA33_10870 [Anaerolineae bacterium]|nr:hypothetical protein [Anaerolineae bacterium]
MTELTTFWLFSVPIFVFEDGARLAQSVAVARALYEKRFNCQAPATYECHPSGRAVQLRFAVPGVDVNQQLHYLEVNDETGLCLFVAYAFTSVSFLQLL